MDKKLGGLSMKVWIGVAIAGLAVGLYLRHRAANSTSTIASTSSQPLSTSVPTSGDIGTALAGGGVSPAPAALDTGTVNDLLAGQAAQSQSEDALTQGIGGLVDAIGTLVYNVGSSAGAGAAPNVTNNYYSTATKPKGKTAPAAKKPVAAAKPKPKAAPAHYYTRKSEVKLAKGQTLHFASGKGYYGA